MGSPNLRWRGKMSVTWEIIYISAWLGISPVCTLSFTTFCILLLLNVQESVSVDSKFALDQVTSVPKEQNLPMLFNEGENSQVIQHLTLCTSLYTWIRCYLHFDVTCLTGFKKRLCAEHHVDIWGYPHVGWVQHAYFRRWSLSCRQSETQVGILNNLIWNKHWLVYMYNNNVIL